MDQRQDWMSVSSVLCDIKVSDIGISSYRDPTKRAITESIPWFKEAVSKILPTSFPGSLRISIYITHPTPTTAASKEQGDKTGKDDIAEVTDSSSSIGSELGDYFSIINDGGRPDLRTIVTDSAAEDSSSLAITG